MVKKLFIHVLFWLLATMFFIPFIHNVKIWFPYRAMFNMFWFYGNFYIHMVLLVPILEKSMLKWQDKDGILDPFIRRVKWILHGSL